MNVCCAFRSTVELRYDLVNKVHVREAHPTITKRMFDGGTEKALRVRYPAHVWRFEDGDANVLGEMEAVNTEPMKRRS